MDLSAIIVMILLGGGFFGFILWMAIHSRKNNSAKSSAGKSEIDFSKIRSKNKQFLKK